MHKVIHAIPSILRNTLLVLGLQELNPVLQVLLEAMGKEEFPVFNRSVHLEGALVGVAGKVVCEQVDLLEGCLVVGEGSTKRGNLGSHFFERVTAGYFCQPGGMEVGGREGEVT